MSDQITDNAVSVKNIYKNWSFKTAFLCGPEEMIKTVSTTLKENHYKESQILFELFTASINDQAFLYDIPKTLAAFESDPSSLIALRRFTLPSPNNMFPSASIQIRLLIL